MIGTQIPEIERLMSAECPCGKKHFSPVKGIFSGKGVINELPLVLKEKYNPSKVFVLADKNTYKAAGEKVCTLLEESGISYTKYVFDTDKQLEPDEWTVGSAVMHFDTGCDVIIAVGSGVVNDTGKILKGMSGKPYIIVGTAPSMDGYASDSSSMTRSGLKISLYSASADLIFGDTDILCNAPEEMLKAGLGDMLAKYISICEWKIAKLLYGEYYCEEIAELVRSALKKCVDNAEGLLKRDEKAVKAVFEGLVITGIAMCFAGVSRPASGGEHYMSHIWDMRKASFGTYINLHGIQCAVGTYISARIYEKLLDITPDKKKALEFVADFDYSKRAELLTELLGNGAKSMIDLEAKEGKFDKEKHAHRLEKIIDGWDEITAIIRDEIPRVQFLDKLYDTVGLPKTPGEAGIDDELLPVTVKVAGDIRDKYVASRLLWDLGLADEIADNLR